MSASQDMTNRPMDAFLKKNNSAASTPRILRDLSSPSLSGRSAWPWFRRTSGYIVLYCTYCIQLHCVLFSRDENRSAVTMRPVWALAYSRDRGA